LSRPDLFEIFTPPAFGLTVFSVSAGVEGLKKRNEITKEVYEAVNAEGDIFITSTTVDGTYAIRVISGNPRIEGKHLTRAFEIIVRKTEGIKARGVHTPPVVEVENEVKGV
jgi:aromatic-L-amino-acid decarboxylase